MISWPLAPTFPAALALVALGSLVEGPTLAAVLAARQRHSPPGLLAQVSMTGASLKVGSFALGTALGGLLVSLLGPTTVIGIVAVVQLCAAASGTLSARHAGSARVTSS
jgi:predicted MFS family arabinose efflux permease